MEKSKWSPQCMCQKEYLKLQSSFMTKKNNTQKLRTERKSLNLVKAICGRLSASIIKMKPEIWYWEKAMLSWFQFDIVLEVPAIIVRQEEKNKDSNRRSEIITIPDDMIVLLHRNTFFLSVIYSKFHWHDKMWNV
jgi:hypothetical protein